MTIDIVDAVWCAMKDDEFYTPADLANCSGQPSHWVVRVLEFLARYGFAERVTKREPIFRKLTDTPAPRDALRVLQMLIEDSSAGEVTPASQIRRGA